MTSFERAIELVLAHEGGYVNDPKDPGGETNFGISKRSFPNVDIAALTREKAVAIYRDVYWRTTGCEEFPAPLGIAVFDAAVNQGRKAAVMMLQEVLGLRADGVVGPATVEAAHFAEGVLESYLARRACHYASLETFPTYGKGWMRRLFRTHLACLTKEI